MHAYMQLCQPPAATTAVFGHAPATAAQFAYISQHLLRCEGNCAVYRTSVDVFCIA